MEDKIITAIAAIILIGMVVFAVIGIAAVSSGRFL